MYVAPVAWYVSLLNLWSYKMIVAHTSVVGLRVHTKIGLLDNWIIYYN